MISSRFKIIVLLSYVCIASLSAAIITPALPQIESSFALSQGQLEWVISVFLLGYVMGQLIYGPLANRFGRLWALRCGLWINLCGILICLIAVNHHHYGLLLLGRLVTALGAASGLSCTFMLLNELLTPERAKKVMAFVILSFTFGTGISVTVGGLITQYGQWSDCFYVLFAHGVMMLALTALFPETLKVPTPLNVSSIFVSYTKALRSRQLVIYSLLLGFITSFNYCYSVAAPLFAQIDLKMSASLYGYWNLLNMLGMLGSGLGSAFLMARFGVKKSLQIGFALMIWPLVSLTLIVLTHSDHALWFFLSTTCGYLFIGLLFPPATYLASNALEDKASASSMMSFINMASGTLCVIVLGYLPLGSLASMVVVVASFYLLMGMLVKFSSPTVKLMSLNANS